MKLYKIWLLEQEVPLALKLTRLAADKSEYYRRAKKLRDKMSGSSKVNPKSAHELNVLRMKINRIERILNYYGSKSRLK